MFLQDMWLLLYWYTRPFIKWLLRKTTKLCELQRICYGERPGAPRILAVEKSLQLSRNKSIKDLIEYLDLLSKKCQINQSNQNVIISRAGCVILQVKKINPQIHSRFTKTFENCVEQIWGYRQLYHQVENLRTTQYDSGHYLHEEKLLELWSLLMPQEKLDCRLTKQWQEIGFQGDDPKTDFRGMGMLGLENLLYFAREFPGPSGHVLSHSHHPKYGYTFAIVGINLTSMAYSLLKDGSAKTYVYNVSRKIPTVKVFHQLYCYLFYEFDRFWIQSKPQNMMEFSCIQERFERSIRSALSDKSTVFRINIEVDNI